MDTPSSRGSVAKDVFQYLLMIAMLYASVGSFLVLIFQYINHLFPDALTYQYGADFDAIRSSTAVLLIVFPVFLVTSWLILRDIRTNQEKTDLWIRKWLLYLTLFLSALTIIIDLITLVYSLLNGDLTVRFLLKVAVVLAVSATVFGFYLWDVRRHEQSTSRLPTAFGSVTAAVVFVSIIAGFFIVGSPFYQRKVRFDLRRVNDLQTIQNEIVTYWQGKNVLPTSLASLTNDISGFRAPVDPETGKPYEYTAKDKRTFELCATFSVPTPQEDQNGFRSYPYDQNWNHGEGRSCFSHSIDPDLNKPYAVPVKG